MADETTPQLGDAPDHGGVTDTDLLAAAAARYAVTAPTTDDADGDTPPSDAAVPPVASDGDSAPTTDPDVWEYDVGENQKLTITKEQARTFAEFEQFLAANPELAQAISGSIVGTHKFLPVETPPPVDGSTAGTTVAPGAANTDALTPPPELDLDDPVQKAVWERLVATNQQLAQASELVQRHDAALHAQQAQTMEAMINRATVSYQTENKLTNEDMDEIKAVAGRLNVLPSLMQPVDPITNLPRNVDPLKALESAFDLAHWQIPRLRDAQLATFQQEARDNTKRKQKLSSLGGSSGSVPRQANAVPTNPQERRQAMIAELATMLNGNWIQPEDS